MKPSVEAPTDARKRLAYLARYEFEDGKAYRGGVLVVDDSGTPREFRCTSPVRPNGTQRILYGDNLDPFMLLELMGKPLLQALRESLDIVLVNDRWLLNLREQMDKPIVFLRPQGAEVIQESTNDQEAPAIIQPFSDEFEPVVVQSFPGQAEDLAFARPLLQECSARIDILEPFQRIGKALAKVHEEKVQDK
jgi:hypothetical protein